MAPPPQPSAMILKTRAVYSSNRSPRRVRGGNRISLENMTSILNYVVAIDVLFFALIFRINFFCGPAFIRETSKPRTSGHSERLRPGLLTISISTASFPRKPRCRCLYLPASGDRFGAPEGARSPRNFSLFRLFARRNGCLTRTDSGIT